MTALYIGSMIAVMALFTALLRFLPFLLFRNGQKTPPVIEKLGKTLPYAIMGMLVIYCLKGIQFTKVDGFLPELIACMITGGLHIWKRNTLISIIGGTVSYMLLVQLVF